MSSSSLVQNMKKYSKPSLRFISSKTHFQENCSLQQFYFSQQKNADEEEMFVVVYNRGRSNISIYITTLGSAQQKADL